MKKILFLILFVAFSGYSQSWNYISKDKFGNKYYIKDKVVSNQNGIVRIWTKATVWKVYDSTKKKTYYDCYQILLYEFDCENEKARVLTKTVYSSKGSIIAEESVDELFASWDYVIPDSVEAKMQETVCKLYNGI